MSAAGCCLLGPCCEALSQLGLQYRSDDLQSVSFALAPVTQVYHASARPVEDFFREHGVLREFYIAGGIPETMPRLMAELAPYRRCLVSRNSSAVIA